MLSKCDKCRKNKKTEDYGFYLVKIPESGNTSMAEESESEKNNSGAEMKKFNICTSCIKRVVFFRYIGLSTSFIILIPAVAIFFSIYSPLLYIKLNEWFYFVTFTIFLIIFTCLYYIYAFLKALKRNTQVIGDDLAKEIYIKTYGFPKLKNYRALNRNEYDEFIKAK